MARERRQWTTAQKAKVVAWAELHGDQSAIEKFAVHPTQMRRWKHGKAMNPTGGQRKAKKKANGAANGIAKLPEKDALTWLERWRSAYFDRMKAETPSAKDVLAALRGDK